MKIHIATSRPIGLECQKLAEELIDPYRIFGGRSQIGNMVIEGEPHPDWKLVDNPDECDVFISVMYGSLVSEQFINCPGRRCYNFHPGILPQYRGSGAFSWTIINGEKECGVTLHELDVNIDTGPVISIIRFPIEGWDTAETLYNKGMQAILSQFKHWFVKIVSNNYYASPQVESQAHTYYRKDLEKVRDLTRWIRAFTFEGKPGSFCKDRQGNIHEVKW